MTASESLELITTMINNTKRRYHLGEGNMFLLWGYVSVIVAIIVTVALLVTRHPACNWLWFLIWVVGGTMSARMMHSKRDKEETHPVTYVDRLTRNVWSTVGYVCIVSVFTALGFLLLGQRDVWIIMLIFGLGVIGAAVTMQGFVLQEKSLIAGGAVGMLGGLIVTCCAVAQINLNIMWAMPLIILCFTLMLIVPGHVLNHKAKVTCSKN